jgi:hypothetical protein
MELFSDSTYIVLKVINRLFPIFVDIMGTLIRKFRAEIELKRATTQLLDSAPLLPLI